MKRIHRAYRAAVVSTVACAIATSTAIASAATPAASIDVSDNSSEPTVTTHDSASLVDAALGLLQSTASVLNGEAVPEFNRDGGSLNIVLDPQSVPGLAEAFAPEGDHSGLTPQKGQDANGNTVVFPTSGRLTSGYGARWGAQHNGIDIANPIGTPIYSVMDGTVISSGPAQGYGNWIRVRHDDGSVAIYGHMQAQSLLVSVGERVTAGQQIASIGSEGRSTGPHLHFEIHPDGVTPTNPINWFAERGITV